MIDLENKKYSIKELEKILEARVQRISLRVILRNSMKKIQ